MCTTFFGYFVKTGKSKDGVMKLLVAFNREEYIDREAEVVERYGDIICGKDKKTGNSWMAYNTRTKRIAILTNYRDKRDIKSSKGKEKTDDVKPKKHLFRGALVMDWVSTDINKEDYSDKIFENLNEYKGFNLVYGQVDEESTQDSLSLVIEDDCESSFLYHISNFNSKILETMKPLYLKPGVVYGMSNGNISEWPKVNLGIKLISESLEKFHYFSTTSQTFHSSNGERVDGTKISTTKDFDNLYKYSKYCIDEVMSNTQKPSLWNVPKTDCSFLLEWSLSSIFVKGKYGRKICTVSSQVLLIDESDQGVFRERFYEFNHSALKSFLCCSTTEFSDKTLTF